MGYGLVLFWRWLFLAIQLAAVAGFVWIYWYRSAPEAGAASGLPGGHSSLAAVVTLPEPEVRKMGLARGMRVDVVRGGSSAPMRGTVMEHRCDDKKCLVYVGLDKAPPGQVIDTATFAAATLVVAPAP